MPNPLVSLFESRKFWVLLVSQVALAVPAAFKVIPPESAATLGVLLVAVWQYAHAHEEKSKIEAEAVIASALGPVVPAAEGAK